MSNIKSTLRTNTINPYLTGPSSSTRRSISATRETEKIPTAYSPGLNYDVVNISNTASQPDCLADSVQNTLEYLSQRYPDIQFAISQETGNQSLAQMAANVGSGLHLIVSQKFIDRMSSSKEDFNKCMQILTETLARLNSSTGKSKGAGAYLDEKKVSFWQLRPEKEVKPTIANQVNTPLNPSSSLFPSLSSQKTASSMNFSVGTTKNFSVSGTYSKVARAISKSDVKTAMSDARMQILSLRMTACFGDEKDVLKARAAIGALNKLLVRGQRKIKKLDKEQLLKIRKRRAEQQAEEKKARLIQMEREKQRSKRKLEDHLLVEDGQHEQRRINSKYRQYTSDIPATLSFIPSIDFSGIGAAAGVDFSASDVVISAEIEF